MLDAAAIAEIARPILEKPIRPFRISEVRVSDFTDLGGDDALSLVVVADGIPPDTNRARIDAGVHLQDELYSKGEERFAFIRYMTPERLRDEARDA